MIDTKSGTDSVIYDDLGRVVKETDSRGSVKRTIVITNVYYTKGYVSQINNGSTILWKMNSSDSRGRPVSYNLGDPNLGLNVQFTYDAQEGLQRITGSAAGRDLVQVPMQDYQLVQLNRFSKKGIS